MKVQDCKLEIITNNNSLTIKFQGELNLYNLSKCEQKTDTVNTLHVEHITLHVEELSSVDTAGAIYLDSLLKKFSHLHVEISHTQKEVETALSLIEKQKHKIAPHVESKKISFVENIGMKVYEFFLGFISFISFLKEVFIGLFHYIKSPKNIRVKEIIFEINESGVKALGIVALTSFLIGLVVAYQSAYQLKMYGANIFVVDMLGISILRELAPLITAIVIAGRSGSAFTAQIGAMKITEELDAMKTMGFDPYAFLVLPRIIALMIVMPILIFVADMMGILGGMIVANIDLNITTSLFLDRFSSEVAIKHFYIGIFKGPFFAFLIASVGIYRGFKVRNDTQSIGFNTTKSVVEAIFAVIVCDAIFSIIFTNMGI